MAPLKIPPELKRITQYIRRAEELDNDKTKPESRLVAYYCRQYAVQSGISLAKSDASRNCLGDILAELEKEKEPMSAFSKEEAYFVSRKFAVEVFDKADAEDRGGVANKGTAKTFYAAAVFLEVLEQFDDNVSEEDMEENKQKRVYAKWKATEILKAIKGGHEIVPGGYGEEAAVGDDVNVKDEGTGSKHNNNAVDEEEEELLPPVPIAPSGTIAANNTIPKVDMHVPPKMNVDHPPAAATAKQSITNNEGSSSGVEVDLYGPPPPAYNVSTLAPGNNASLPVVPMAPPADMPPPVHVPAPPSSGRTVSSMLGFGNARTNGSHGKKLSKEQWDDAKELARFALVAIDARDVDLAAARLQQALQALGR
eukprot:CAMPEP_0196804384 /NCGR_PEP_ID=MMETSP1362-20130617/3979_1 /TAXON_ID=163516 /ORGANISM="Leptocylindrus danicus, Strain CCMP1856" /LENGTH=366 /DNA_ID=CAMNT_0042176645 /DNA_START=88 /DNA_END=1188 /DNA_ORIENTATION=+